MKIIIELDTHDHKERELLGMLLGFTPTTQSSGTQPNITVMPEDRKEPEVKSAPAEEEQVEEAALAEEEEPAAEEPAAEEDEGPDPLGDDEPEVTYTLEDVRNALKSYATRKGRPAAIKLIKDNGAAAVGDLEPETYPIIMTAIEADE